MLRLALLFANSVVVYITVGKPVFAQCLSNNSVIEIQYLYGCHLVLCFLKSGGWGGVRDLYLRLLFVCFFAYRSQMVIT